MQSRFFRRYGCRHALAQRDAGPQNRLPSCPPNKESFCRMATPGKQSASYFSCRVDSLGGRCPDAIVSFARSRDLMEQLAPRQKKLKRHEVNSWAPDDGECPMTFHSRMPIRLVPDHSSCKHTCAA